MKEKWFNQLFKIKQMTLSDKVTESKGNYVKKKTTTPQNIDHRLTNHSIESIHLTWDIVDLEMREVANVT